MSDPLVIAEKVLALLNESSLTTTYKPALLLALIDRAQEFGGEESIKVRALAERVVELYWRQTFEYLDKPQPLRQSSTTSGSATITDAIRAFRESNAPKALGPSPALHQADGWEGLLDRVEYTLAEWPIPASPTSLSGLPV